MYRSRKPVNWVTFRIVLVVAVFALGTLLLVVRAYRLQIADAEGLKKRADKQRTRVLHLEVALDHRLEEVSDQGGSDVLLSV